MGYSVSELRAIGRAIPIPVEEPKRDARAVLAEARARLKDGVTSLPAPGGLLKKLARPRVESGPDETIEQMAEVAAPVVETSPAPVARVVEAKPPVLDATPAPEKKREQAAVFLTPFSEIESDAQFAATSSAQQQAQSHASHVAPEAAHALLASGMRKIEADDHDGLDDLVSAILHDPRVANFALPRACSYLASWPDGAEKDAYNACLDRIFVDLATADRERQRAPRLFERFQSASLADFEVSAFNAILSFNPDIVAATLARRPTTQWVELPAFAISIHLRRGWKGKTAEHRADAEKRLMAGLEAMGAYGTVIAIYPTTVRDYLLTWRWRRMKGAWRYAREA